MRRSDLSSRPSIVIGTRPCAPCQWCPLAWRCNSEQRSYGMAAVPFAVSRLGEHDSREAQNTRALQWLLEQPGGPIAVVTPRSDFSGDSLKRLVAHPRVVHRTWRGFSAGS